MVGQGKDFLARSEVAVACKRFAGSRFPMAAYVAPCIARSNWGEGEFGRYYEECRGRGMRHNKALKAVARKRLKVIYAIMRDRVPYRAA